MNDSGVGSDDWLATLSAEEAMIAWTLCSRLADAIWTRHESAQVERLVAEHDEQHPRCEFHPWHRRPCSACEENENLEFDFDALD